MRRESGENSDDLIQLLCAAIDEICFDVDTLNIFMYLSSDPVRRNWPSNEKESDRTGPEWDLMV